jgi:hypothetical protein
MPLGCGLPTLIRRLTSLPDRIRAGKLCCLPIENNGRSIDAQLAITNDHE